LHLIALDCSAAADTVRGHLIEALTLITTEFR
jgi:hypothetical protein